MIKTKITFAGWVLRFLAIVMLLSTMAGCQTLLTAPNAWPSAPPPPGQNGAGNGNPQ
jgi:hypothetical protein